MSPPPAAHCSTLRIWFNSSSRRLCAFCISIRYRSYHRCLSQCFVLQTYSQEISQTSKTVNYIMAIFFVFHYFVNALRHKFSMRSAHTPHCPFKLSTDSLISQFAAHSISIHTLPIHTLAIRSLCALCWVTSGSARRLLQSSEIFTSCGCRTLV